MKQNLFIFTLLLAFAACSKEPGTGTDESRALDFTLTRSGTPDPAEVGQTYRFMIYSADSTIYRYNGTYVNSAAPTQTGVLLPCRVDDAGDVVLTGGKEYNPNFGVHLVNGEYSVSVVSPAVKFYYGTWNTFDISRFEPFLASDPEPLAVNGYGVYEIKNPLIDRRMRFTGINFLRGDDITSDFTLSDLTLVNAGQTGLYHSNNRKIEPLGADPVFELRKVDALESAAFAAANPQFDDYSKLYYACHERGVDQTSADDGKMPIYLMHGCFGQFGMNPLALRFDMTIDRSGEDKTYQFRLPLVAENFDFQPSQTYRLNITIKTIIVTVTIEIFENNAWELDNNTDWENIGLPTQVITIGSWNINDWEEGANPGTPEVIG